MAMAVVTMKVMVASFTTIMLTCLSFPGDPSGGAGHGAEGSSGEGTPPPGQDSGNWLMVNELQSGSTVY